MTRTPSPVRAANTLVTKLGTIQRALDAIERADPDVAAEGLAADAIAAAALVQDLRRRLADVENALTTGAGKVTGKASGNLPDGRQFTLQRASDRKEWDHDDWKRDARRTIAHQWAINWVPLSVDDDTPADTLVNRTTGETATLERLLQEALTEAQEVHGSTAPRSTALKRLGLYASDYCTSQPSGWRLTVKPAETTTTEK